MKPLEHWLTPVQIDRFLKLPSSRKRFFLEQLCSGLSRKLTEITVSEWFELPNPKLDNTKPSDAFKYPSWSPLDYEIQRIYRIIND